VTSRNVSPPLPPLCSSGFGLWQGAPRLPLIIGFSPFFFILTVHPVGVSFFHFFFWTLFFFCFPFCLLGNKIFPFECFLLFAIPFQATHVFQAAPVFWVLARPPGSLVHFLVLSLLPFLFKGYFLIYLFFPHNVLF